MDNRDRWGEKVKGVHASAWLNDDDDDICDVTTNVCMCIYIYIYHNHKKKNIYIYIYIYINKVSSGWIHFFLNNLPTIKYFSFISNHYLGNVNMCCIFWIEFNFEKKWNNEKNLNILLPLILFCFKSMWCKLFLIF